MFRQDCPLWLGQIRDAIAAENFPALRAATHSFKGSIGTFAAIPALEAALHLEAAAREKSKDEIERAYRTLEAETDRLTLALSAISALSKGASAR